MRSSAATTDELERLVGSLGGVPMSRMPGCSSMLFELIWKHRFLTAI